MTQEELGSLGQALDASGSVSLVQCRVMALCLQPLLLLHSLLPSRVGFGKKEAQRVSRPPQPPAGTPVVRRENRGCGASASNLSP